MKGASACEKRVIAIWLPAYVESTGGIQTFCQELIRAITGGARQGALDISIKNDRGAGTLPEAPGAHVRSFGKWPNGPLRTLVFSLTLFLVALRERPALIIVGHANFARLASLLRRWLGIPYWVVLHGVEAWDRRGDRVGKYLRDAERLVTVSRFTRDKVCREQQLDLGRFSVLPNTVDGDRFRPLPKSDTLSRKLGLEANRKIVLTVCRLIQDEMYKGYDQVLAALPTVIDAVPEVHYVIAGSGNDIDRVRAELERRGLGDRVTLAGYVPGEELVDYYNLCDVFAMPSKREGFGIVFIEALACGKPVIAGNGDGAADALRDGEFGLLVDPEDKAALAEALVSLLRKTNPHPIIFRPEELRRRTLEYFGRRRFAATLQKYLADSLDAGSRLERS